MMPRSQVLSRHGQRDRFCEIGIVDRIGRVGPEILIVARKVFKHFLQSFLHLEPAVVRADGDTSALGLARSRRGVADECDVALASQVSRQRRDQSPGADPQRGANAGGSDIVFGDESPVGEVRHGLRSILLGLNLRRVRKSGTVEASARRGGCARKCRVSDRNRGRGGGWTDSAVLLLDHHPVRSIKGSFAISFLMSRPPLLARRGDGSPQTFTKKFPIDVDSRRFRSTNL